MTRSSVDNYRRRYASDRYCLVKSLLTPDVAARFLADVAEDINRVGPEHFFGQTSIHSAPGIEIYSHHYKILNALQWGVTGLVREITSANLVPGFAYFQIYQKGNRLFVHSDRASCEHSLSLTLGYSDNLPWDLTVSKAPVDHVTPGADKAVADDHGDEDYFRVSMQPGDAVLYPGYNRRHGRLEPNPNRWSAHVFMHWVDADGPHAQYAYDGKERNTAVDFDLSHL